MEEILEIRDGCETPLQLLKSKAFAQYLNIYKKQFTKDLELRKDTDQKEEAIQKIKYIKSIKPKTFIDILEGATPFSGDELMQHRQSVRFFDGAFHHYRNKSYTRLVRLHNEILDKSETPESILSLIHI